MKIALVQFRPAKGDLPDNLSRHLRLAEQLAEAGADAVFFPELSLSGYEPALAEDLASAPDDPRLEAFQHLADTRQLSLGVGLSLRTGGAVRIGMLFFQPGQARTAYAKQHLHPDERPYFQEGDRQILFSVSGLAIAPAICYESLQPEHAERAVESGARAYLASVAKPRAKMEAAYRHYAVLARRFSMPVFLVNAVGPCDDFTAAGGSAVWTAGGCPAGSLDGQQEGWLLVDPETGSVEQKTGL